MEGRLPVGTICDEKKKKMLLLLCEIKHARTFISGIFQEVYRSTDVSRIGQKIAGTYEVKWIEFGDEKPIVRS